MRKPETIERLYLDFDGFFASVHQQIQPNLRGKPVGVIPFDAKPNGRMTVIACSREAKAAGCKNVMPVRDAWNVCPEIILVPQRPDLYLEFHNNLKNEIECEIPIETTKSIDELSCVLDRRDIANPRALAARVKARIANHIGQYITCSIGFAANRLLAKMACKVDKPNGVTIWNPADGPGALFKRPLSDVPGVGKEMTWRLMFAGINSIEELYNAQPKQCRAIWKNVNGERMWYALHGYEVYADPTQRGMFGHGRVLPPNERSTASAVEASRLLLAKAARRMRRDGYFANVLSLWIGTREWHWEKSSKLHYVQDEQACQSALAKLWAKAKQDFRRTRTPEVIQIGVTLSNLSERNKRQLDLFINDDRDRRRWEAISRTMDELNAKFGKRVITLGWWNPPPGGFAGGKIAFNRLPSAEDFW